MAGRLKTLHPKIHGGLLCRRDQPEHLKQAEEHGIDLIDLVVVNLYPFQATIACDGVTLSEAIEQIDIGGPTMLRSAAKNYDAITVVCDPADYTQVLNALAKKQENSLKKLRYSLASKVFQHTADYDQAISTYLQQARGKPDQLEIETLAGFPPQFHLSLPRAQTLRYGENPHQQAALYGRFFDCCEQLQGKALSYNNIIDITAAIRLIGEFVKPTTAIIKHTNPCGVASAENISTAWQQALATDSQAAFGGIIIVNRTLEHDLAKQISKIFCEVLIAPHFTDEARVLLAKKKNLRLISTRQGQGAEGLQDISSVIGGVLVQDRDRLPVRREDYTVVTQRAPTEAEWQALLFGWRVVKHIKSNAVLLATAERTLGIGAGQMSRVDSAKIAIQKATAATLPLSDSVVASDAFFPFADGLITNAEAGACAAIQPGGSLRDSEVIAAADERNMAMVFTHHRHFFH